jgi:hypothetical protein
MPKKSDRMARTHDQVSGSSSVNALAPEPQIMERVIHGQRLRVKVYPPVSDPTWSEWVRYKIRAPLDMISPD